MVQVSNSGRMVQSVDTTDKQLVIGAGFVGLGMAQGLAALGLRVPLPGSVKFCISAGAF